MKKFKLFRKPIAIYSSAVLAIASLFCAASVQSRPTRYEISLEWPGEEPGTPGDRTGGGTRRDGVCQLPPAALVRSRKKDEVLVEKTYEESANLWVYLPVPFSALKSGKVLLFPLGQDDGQPVYRQDITQTTTLPNKPGIVSFQLPRLQPNQMYKWRLKLTIDCGSPSSPSSQDFQLYGGIKRVELPPEIKKKLESAQTDLERFNIYKEAGIWHDAMTALATLRRNNPADPQIKEAWVKLLGEVNWKPEWERFSDGTPQRNQQKQFYEKLEETIAGAEILSP